MHSTTLFQKANSVEKSQAGNESSISKISSNKSQIAKKKVVNEFDFDSHLIELGKSSLQLLKEQKFENFDPLLGDWSCQLRTLWLIKLLREKPNLENLSDAEFKTLGLYKLLTDSTVTRVDAFGETLHQETNDNYKPPGWEAVSNKKMSEYYGKAKAQLSSFTIDFLIENIKNSAIKYKESILDSINHQVFTSFSGVPIKFIEFLPGFYSIIELAKEQNIPITVGLKQFFLNNEGHYQLNGATALLYKTHDDKLVCSDPNNDSDTPSLVIQMYSAISSQSEVTQRKLLTQHDFEMFCNDFKKLDIVDTQYAIVAYHQQYPSQAYVLANKEHLPVNTIKDCDDLNLLKDKYLKLNEETQVGRDSYFDLHRDTLFFTKNIPINIKHVYVSTFKKVAEEMNAAVTRTKNMFFDLNKNYKEESEIFKKSKSTVSVKKGLN